MITNINTKILANMYQMGYSTFQKYLAPHRNQLRAMAARRVCTKKGKIVLSRNYNSHQLKYIVENIMGDSPEGYVFNGSTFVVTLG